MRVAILGAGGVGGYFGARLAAAGHDVAFLARGAHAEAMRRDGLRLESALGDVRIHPAAVFTDPGALGIAELVIVAVKLWDSAAAMAALPAMTGATTAVVSLQNGIEKDELLAAAVGPRAVVGGVTYISATIAAPGVVRHVGALARLALGELGGEPSARIADLVAAFQAAGVAAEASPDVRRATWEKFVFLTAASAVNAVTRLPVGPLRRLPETRALFADALAEGVALAAAEGADLGRDFVERQMALLDGLAPETRASMAQDLLRGRRLELEWLSGAIVRRAARLGLSTPVHRTLFAALAPYANGAPTGAAPPAP